MNISSPELENSPKKPLASISLDLDNLWSYMKTHGDSGWECFPSYLDTLIPNVLDVLDKLNLKITFFIVGQDAALAKNHDVLKMLTERGHEVGNHSFHHEVWLDTFSKDNIRKELLQAEEHIYSATGQKPIGFRGPGFVWNTELLEILAERNYLYDASLLPTFIGPLARMYYFWKSDLNSQERAKRGRIYSGFKEGLRPVKPYYWDLGDGSKILEIPVTTVPIFKTPFHLSYLIYLSRFSIYFMIFYLEIAVNLCRITGTSPSFLLHPLDFISNDEVEGLEFFPGMNLKRNIKTGIFNTVIRYLRKSFYLKNMSIHAQSMVDSNLSMKQRLN